jgi:hypothetical protein
VLFEDFSQSWFNRPHRVAGAWLRPFCLWHHAYLHFVNSPLAPGIVRPRRPDDETQPPPLPGWPDIELAVRICQLRYEEVLPVKQPSFLKLRMFVVMSRTTEEKERAAFYDYIADYFAPPRFNEWTSHSRSRGGPPDPLAVASACIMLFGGGREVEKWVWEMPIGKAYWYSSTLHYNRGAPLDYITARQVAIRRALRQKAAEGKLKQWTPEERVALQREARARAAEFMRQRNNPFIARPPESGGSPPTTQ